MSNILLYGENLKLGIAFHNIEAPIVASVGRELTTKIILSGLRFTLLEKLSPVFPKAILQRIVET